MPIILKGVQRWEDALRAYDDGCAGVVLSNHGGRQLDTAPSGIEVLVSVVRAFKEKRGITFPIPDGRFQLFVDGGVRRATDVLKAVALGDTAGKWRLCDTEMNGLPRTEAFTPVYFVVSYSGYWKAVLVCVFVIWSGWN